MSDDPGGVFASDIHRRVLGHLPPPEDPAITVAYLFVRLAPDHHTPIYDEVGLEGVLLDLEAEGYATQTEAGWSASPEGSKALTA